jgi:hypothetical protein
MMNHISAWSWIFKTSSSVVCWSRTPNRLTWPKSELSLFTRPGWKWLTKILICFACNGASVMVCYSVTDTLGNDLRMNCTSQTLFSSVYTIDCNSLLYCRYIINPSAQYMPCSGALTPNIHINKHSYYFRLGWTSEWTFHVNFAF